MAEIALEGLRKVFAGGHTAVAGLDLRVADGERLALVGPSGSGKSTVLRLIAGLEAPTAGRVFVGGRDVTDVPPEGRDLTMVFQSYALYPHMTVRANLGFGLRIRGRPATEIAAKVRETAEAIGLADLLDRMPSQLSGGQRQRVALGRAIVRSPHAFLFDEPLSNLDPRLRGDVRAELVRLHARLGATMVYVTHDQEEAMTLGERIAVLRDGRLEQIGPPENVYARPANVFVAGFIGSPPMNLLRGHLTPREGHQWLDMAEATIDLGAGPLPAAEGAEITVGIRPHDVTRHDGPGAAIQGRVDIVEPLGHAQVVHVAVSGSTRLIVVTPSDEPLAAGNTIGLAFRSDRLHVFDDAGNRTRSIE